MRTRIFVDDDGLGINTLKWSRRSAMHVTCSSLNKSKFNCNLMLRNLSLVHVMENKLNARVTPDVDCYNPQTLFQARKLIALVPAA